MEVVIELLLHEVVDELIDAYTAGGRHILRAQLHLGLRLEDGFLYIDSYRSDNAVADIHQFLVLIEELLDGTTDGFFVGLLVRTALYGVLAVDEREIFVVILVGMRQGYLNILALEVNNRIERIDGHILRQ